MNAAFWFGDFCLGCCFGFWFSVFVYVCGGVWFWFGVFLLGFFFSLESQIGLISALV